MVRRPDQGSPLDSELFKSGISLLATQYPEALDLRLPPKLRKKSLKPIPGYSKAS